MTFDMSLATKICFERLVIISPQTAKSSSNPLQIFNRNFTVNILQIVFYLLFFSTDLFEGSLLKK